MKTIDLNTPMNDHEGVQVPDKTLAKVLSEFLATETEGKTLKLYGWHKTLQAGSPLVLDEADLQDLKELVSNNKRLYVFVKGQLLDKLSA